MMFIMGMLACLLLVSAWLAWEYGKWKRALKIHNDPELQQRRDEIIKEAMALAKRTKELQIEMEKLNGM